MLDLDGHHLHLNTQHLRQIEIGGAPPRPLTIELGLTNRCTDSCTYCAFSYKKGDQKIELDTENLLEWIRHIPAAAKPLPKSFHIAGDGEPTLHPDFVKIVKTISNYGYDVGLTTNGASPQKILKVMDSLAWCRFSVDAGTEDVYKRLHRCSRSLDDTFATITAAVLAAKTECVVGVQCLILDQPKEDLCKLFGRCVDAELNYLAFKPYSHHPQSDNAVETTAGEYIEEMVKNRAYSDLTLTPQVILRRELSPKDYIGCLTAGSLFWTGSADGRLYPCAQFIGDSKWCLGDLTVQDYQSIIESRKYRIVRRELWSKNTSSCRHPCRCDAANRYMNRLARPEVADGFI